MADSQIVVELLGLKRMREADESARGTVEWNVEGRADWSIAVGADGRLCDCFAEDSSEQRGINLAAMMGIA